MSWFKLPQVPSSKKKKKKNPRVDHLLVVSDREPVIFLSVLKITKAQQPKKENGEWFFFVF